MQKYPPETTILKLNYNTKTNTRNTILKLNNNSKTTTRKHNAEAEQ
jgi:hypothetical protein